MRNRSEKAVATSRRLRSAQSVGEKRMWIGLRKSRLGFRFRRQQAVGPYVLDFYCLEAKIAVEMDSDLHDPERDALRDAYLSKLGIKVIRIHNLDYLQMREGEYKDWLTLIQKECETRTGRPAFPD